MNKTTLKLGLWLSLLGMVHATECHHFRSYNPHFWHPLLSSIQPKNPRAKLNRITFADQYSQQMKKPSISQKPQQKTQTFWSKMKTWYSKMMTWYNKVIPPVFKFLTTLFFLELSTMAIVVLIDTNQRIRENNTDSLKASIMISKILKGIDDKLENIMESSRRVYGTNNVPIDYVADFSDIKEML